MRRIYSALIVSLAAMAATLAGAGTAAAGAPAAGAESFQRGQMAVARNDSLAALDQFEAALSAEPDNLRYGAEYRQAVIAAEEYDRAIGFFEALVAAHPEAGNAQMNLGYAFVDKIPAVGAITQVILANTALTHFSAALEQGENWLRLYTRGNSYLYWPAIFGRTELGIADLKKAIALSEKLGRQPFHAHAYAALGDAYWRLDDVEQARRTWREGLERFPSDAELETRLARQGEDLDAFLDAHFATETRVETDLRELWEAP